LVISWKIGDTKTWAALDRWKKKHSVRHGDGMTDPLVSVFPETDVHYVTERRSTGELRLKFGVKLFLTETESQKLRRSLLSATVNKASIGGAYYIIRANRDSYGVCNQRTR
jgi:hypothetical protein